MSLVLDTSVTLSWHFEDERTPATEAVLAQVVERGAVVPSLWRLEVANGLQSALRRRRITAAYRDATLRDLALLDIAIDPETDAEAWKASLGLADRFGLTLYDAAYLELAVRRRLPLASLDRPLRSAADKLGLRCLGHGD